MSLKRAALLSILLLSVIFMAGCTGTSPAPVASPVPTAAAITVTSVPVPSRTAVTTAPTTAWTYTFVPDPTHAYSKTYTFEATGTYDEHTFTTDSDRTWVFRMSCPAREYFTVTLRDNHGDVVDVLADEPGVFAGTESVWLKAGTYRLDVHADAPWTITVSTA